MPNSKKRKRTKKKNNNEERVLMNLKVSRKDRKVLEAMAKKYARGNLSAWLRFAGKNFKPSKAQFSLFIV